MASTARAFVPGLGSGKEIVQWNVDYRPCLLET